MKYAYKVMGLEGNKPRGVYGTYQTKDSAERESDRRRGNTKIVRVKVSQKTFDSLPS